MGGMKSLWILVCVLLLINSFGYAFEDKDDSEKADKSNGFVALYIGALSSFIEGWENTMAFTYGAAAGYRINDNVLANIQYSRYSKSIESVSLSQSFLDIGLSLNGIGAGVCISTFETLSGTGFYLEVVTREKGAYAALKLDLVTMGGEQAGAFTFNIGFIFDL